MSLHEFEPWSFLAGTAESTLRMRAAPALAAHCSFSAAAPQPVLRGGGMPSSAGTDLLCSSYPFQQSEQESVVSLHHGTVAASFGYAAPSSFTPPAFPAEMPSLSISSSPYSWPGAPESEIFPPTILDCLGGEGVALPKRGQNLDSLVQEDRSTQPRYPLAPPPLFDGPLPLAVPTNSLLHRVCFGGTASCAPCFSSTSSSLLSLQLRRIAQVLKVDPHAAGRAEAVAYTVKRWAYSPLQGKMIPQLRKVRAPYSFPLHLAVASASKTFRREWLTPTTRRFDPRENEPSFCQGSSRQIEEAMLILRVLVRAAPEVLSLADGAADASSLAILLRELSPYCRGDPAILEHCLSMVRYLVDLEPMLVHRKDRYGNTPLHAACQSGAPRRLVRAVYHLDPTALAQKNMHGHTPLDVSNLRMAAGTLKEQEQVASFLKSRWDASLVLPVNAGAPASLDCDDGSNCALLNSYGV